jgi:cystathionine beta-lyase/cystathionine gamma-synthase
MAGVVAGPRNLLGRIREWQILLGSVLSPDAAWMLFRGLRTLGLRVPRQSATAGCIAATLAGHRAIRSVFYPGLGDNALPAGQMLGGGGMVSFELRDAAAARRFMDGLTSIPVATSLGGVETVVELPLDLDFDRDAIGPSPPGLVRLSVGLEPADELLADLVHALDNVDAACHS